MARAACSEAASHLRSSSNLPDPAFPRDFFSLLKPLFDKEGNGEIFTGSPEKFNDPRKQRASARSRKSSAILPAQPLRADRRCNSSASCRCAIGETARYDGIGC